MQILTLQDSPNDYTSQKPYNIDNKTSGRHQELLVVCYYIVAVAWQPYKGFWRHRYQFRDLLCRWQEMILGQFVIDPGYRLKAVKGCLKGVSSCNDS
ncbi:hypothetical protein FRX31_025878 [Thalictrum thalictroides]|uniref:Uncharacterized protein n=1 Tax=Thalictrum thalictroides TaxID=46969 RepID=A0A7J6VK04_THATH|nr:hypothetical protein FRX31_025878 [Thalictrum thalictroides]